MQRRSFVFRLANGMQQEYIRRHRDIGPEMLDMLRQAGISNYSIWLCQDRIFGYYESEDLRKTDDRKAASKVQAAWTLYMTDILLSIDEEGKPIDEPKCVFLLE